MSEQVIIALIGTIGAVLTAALGLIVNDLKKVKRDAAISRSQTQNSHKSNLRDDIDGKHDVVLEKLEAQDKHNEQVLKILGGLERSDSQQWTVINEMRHKKRRWF
jgi:hypothetical protein